MDRDKPYIPRALYADLMVMARYVVNLPPAKRVEAARDVIREARAVHAAGRHGADLTTVSMDRLSAFRPGKECRLSTLDGIDAVEAVLIALREVAEEIEGMEAAA